MANDKYIGDLKESFATSLPSRIAGFFAEPIQVLNYFLESWSLKKLELYFYHAIHFHYFLHVQYSCLC